MPVLTAVSPLDPTTGTRVTLRFCNTDDPRVTGLNDLTWWPGVAKAPALNREAFNGDFSSQVVIANGAVSINLHALRKVDTNAPFYRYAGAPVAVYYAPDIDADWADYEQRFTGLVSDHGIESGVMNLSCAVDSEPFEADLMSLKYLGTGDAEGTEDLKDKVKPMVFGYAQNVEPVMINTVDNIYQVHGYGPIEDISNVYERALDFGPSLGDYASYAALRDANIPEGSWGTCLAQGMFRLGAPPFGLITADVKGDNTGGWHRSTAEVINRMCSIAGVDPARIDSASMTAFATACPEPINLDLNASTALLDMIQALALPCNAQAALSWDGRLQITRFGLMPTVADFALDAQGRQLPPVLDNAELGVSPPYWRMEMWAARCWRVQSKDEIAFFDEDSPFDIFIRYPSLPPTPTGNGVPAGWFDEQPTYSPPVNVGGFDQFGPIWTSTGMQHAGITSDDGWTEPVVSDILYRGWVLVSQNTGAKVLGSTDGLKAAADFDPASDVFPYCFINRPVTGPWHFRCKVRSGNDNAAFGIIPYNPAVVDGHFGIGDIKDGFYIAHDDALNIDTADATGVFVIKEYDPKVNMVDTSNAIMLDTPLDECEFEMVFNGETIEHWINGEAIRTHFINQSWETLATYWPVFLPLSPNAEIYDIVWERATQARELDFRLDESGGPLRRMKDQNGWEVYAPHITLGFGVGFLLSKPFKGGCYVKARHAGTSGDFSLSILEIGGVARFTFYADGSVLANNAIGGSPVWTGTWADDDEWSIDWDRKNMRFYKNGTLLKEHKRTAPSGGDAYFEFGAHASFYDMDVTPRGEGTYTFKGAISSTTLLTPLLDTSPTISGGWVVLATTADLVYSGIDTSNFDLVEASAGVFYTKTAGAAADVTLQIQIQKSFDSGVSWSDTGSPQTGPASTTGTAQQALAGGEDQISGSGPIRYRLLGKNLTAGTFSADISGTLAASWVG
jgi:hypothetical protein